MRRAQPKPKERETVPIPGNLRSFLAEVSAAIENGDEAAQIPSDDLLQCAFAYGGLINASTERFGFTYFPEDSVRHKWIFEMSRKAIADVANGSEGSLVLWACSGPGCHSKFSTSDELCFYCDYVDEERDAKQTVVATFEDAGSREEWVARYLRSFPDSHALMIIGDYNECGIATRKAWKPFSLGEMQALLNGPA